MVRLSGRITRMENEVHQAMAVVDADTGKLLNYRQLMRSTKYREAWSLSSANEFGRLANGIGGRIKNPPNTIKFIFHHEVPLERMKDVTYGQFVCATRKGRTQLDTVHCRGRQNQLPRRSCHPNSGNAGGKNALQQRNLHKRCTLNDNGHIQFLPYDTFTLSRIYSIETKQHT
jgi:hypothetical protein